MNIEMTAKDFVLKLMMSGGVIMCSGANDYITVNGPVKINAKKLGLQRLNLKNIVFRNSVKIHNFIKKEVLLINSAFLKGLTFSNLVGSQVLLILARISKMYFGKMIECIAVTTDSVQLVIFISKGIIAQLCDSPVHSYRTKLEFDSLGEMSFQA